MNVLSKDWSPPEPSGVAIGVFDGVHRGHQAVIGELIGHSQARGLAVGVLTFDPHPIEVLAPGREPALLTTLGDRRDLIQALGANWVGTLNLADIRTMSPDDFIRAVLLDRANAGLVSVGDDFRFGYQRAGDVDLLRDRGAALGFDVVPCELVTDEFAVISSSRIRAQIEEGRVAAAAQLLGRPHRLRGEVVRGDSRGHDLGYPTANIVPPHRMAVPADGIYAVLVDGRAGVASLGVRPTFGSDGRRLLEVHIFDFSDQIYGRELAVDFLKRIRGEEKFDRVDDLVDRMDEDARAARKITREFLATDDAG